MDKNLRLICILKINRSTAAHYTVGPRLHARRRPMKPPGDEADRPVFIRDTLTQPTPPRIKIMKTY